MFLLYKYLNLSKTNPFTIWSFTIYHLAYGFASVSSPEAGLYIFYSLWFLTLSSRLFSRWSGWGCFGGVWQENRFQHSNPCACEHNNKKAPTTICPDKTDHESL